MSILKRLKVAQLSSLFRRKSNADIETVKPKRKISWKLPSIPSMSFSFFSISSLWNRPPFRWIKLFPFRQMLGAFRQMLGVLMFLLSILGFVVIFKNPMPWIESFFPIKITTSLFWIHLEQTSVESLLNTLYTDTFVFSTALSVMVFLVVISFILLVQKPMTALRALGRGIKHSPRAVLYSPITFYRRIVIWRTWVLTKYEYLQGESAKWRTTFTIVKLPYSILRSFGLSPQLAASLLIGGSVVGTGVVANEIMEGASFARGDPGIYTAPLDSPVFSAEKYNTLRLDLGSTSVGNITIENISLGTAYTGSALPSGESNVILVGGLPTTSNPSFTQTYLEVGHLIIDRWRCERLDISNSEIHHLIVSGNASDGQSISAVPGTPRDRGINGGNRADDMTTSGGYYDMLKITAASSGVNGKVDVLRLSNLYSKGGACTLQYLKVGTMEVTLNEIGGDETLSTKAFTIATSVVYKSFTNTSNVEVSMPVPVVQ